MQLKQNIVDNFWHQAVVKSFSTIFTIKIVLILSLISAHFVFKRLSKEDKYITKGVNMD